MPYNVVVIRQHTAIASYGPFASLDTANEFKRIYLDHESNVQIVPCYGTFEQFTNRDEMKYV